jgi:uncharacterized coiled-coil DUF342 family protein
MTTKQLINDLTDIVEKETRDISNDITNLKDNIEDWVGNIRGDIIGILGDLQGNYCHIDLGTIHDALETIEEEQDKLKDAIDTIAQEQDKLKDDIKDIREKLGEILTILHSLPK